MAIPTLTIYSATADPTTLRAIFNSVAMVCQNSLFVWGFAVLVAMWRLSASTASAALRTASGQGGVVLGNGALSTMMPFILATLLTNPMAKSTVQIESTVNGSLTQVDNVPLAISAIPVAGSILSMELNDTVATAFQLASAEYPTISASANGFLNPLKLLLSARTATSRLIGVDSEVKTVLAACLGPDSGVNYANIQNLVMNAGNTGATNAQSISINGINPTAIGALLYQASLNATGKVNDPGLDAVNILSCTDAAYKVADDITNALNSLEFPRVVQGAVNGLDAPRPGADYSFNSIAAQYYAVSRANTLGGVFAGGTGQANAEFMNLLFSEMVQGDLNCLRAAGDTLVQCQATVLQAAEVERNNLQAAASEVPAMRYAGAFGNYLLALIIGLGPVIVMFMMFAGIEAGKSVKTAAHIIAWPMLVNNVGAEIVNGMLAIDIANFLQALRQGGWISQATTLTAYKELSLQIGVGSHIMSSLPVLMSIIFGLGESSAMTTVATTIAPRSKETTDNVAPAPQATRPMFEGGPVGTIRQLGHGAGNLAMTGSVDAVSTSMSFGNMAREASRALTESDARSRTISAGESSLADFRRAFSTGDYSRVGIDRQVGQSLAENFNNERRAGHEEHSGNNVTGLRSNANRSTVGGGVSASAKLGKGFGVGGGVHADTSTTSDDALQRNESRGGSDNYADSVALTKALSKTMSEYSNTSAGRQSSSELSRALSTQRSYQQSLSQVSSVTDAATQGVRDSSSFVNMSGKIGSEEIAWQQRANPEYASFQVTSGRLFDDNPATRRYRETAAADAASGATGRMVGDRAGQDAINRHRAAVMLAQDQTAKPADRLAASRYLAEEARAMQHMRFDPTNPAAMNMSVPAPTDTTGVKGSDVGRLAHRALPAPAAARPVGGVAIPGDGTETSATAAATTGAAAGRSARGAPSSPNALAGATVPTMRSTSPSSATSTAATPAGAASTVGRASGYSATNATTAGAPAAPAPRGSGSAPANAATAAAPTGANSAIGQASVEGTKSAPNTGPTASPGLRGSGPAPANNAASAEPAGVAHSTSPFAGAGPIADRSIATRPNSPRPRGDVTAANSASGIAESARGTSTPAVTTPHHPGAGTSPRSDARGKAERSAAETRGTPASIPGARSAESPRSHAPQPAQPAGAAGAPAAHTRNTAPQPSRDPLTPPPVPNQPAGFAPDFEREINQRLGDRQKHVERTVQSAEQQAADAGLDAKGHGTMIRTAANVGDNIADLGRTAGSGSRTGLAGPATKPRDQRGTDSSGNPNTTPEKRGNR
ncbi:putative type IV secretion system protein [Burkholderia pseudomallei]|uniref:conjugal transfer protein TraG N-terminal domain-containing protein n=1 Tax=Burkholderia pseudomallei TaxID=28450 RepID=UPI00051052F5|nr:conjugal transfer protein TraG N-terminal domain-containing protein [Burkholderia pseudomallei]KGC70088.1 putative type IV secretion system protein [Burkholderia pseudomallei]